MNIGFFSEAYYPQINGVVTVTQTLKKELTSRGHKVYNFVPEANGLKNDGSNFFFKSLPLPIQKNTTFAVFPYLSAPRIASKLNLDIIHAHTPFSMGLAGLCISKINKIPIVGTFHTPFGDVLKPMVGNFLSSLISGPVWKENIWFYNNCDIVTVPSNYVREIIYDKGIKSTVYVPNCIDFNSFEKQKSDIRKRHDLQNSFLVLHVGRLSPERNTFSILKSAKVLISKKENVKFVILSDGPQRKELQDWVKKENLEKDIIFTGFVSKNEISSYYEAADIFVSDAPHGVMDLTMLEALYFGKPIVASKFNKPEMIKHGKNGYLHNGTTSQISEYIKFLMDDSKMLERMSKEAKKSATDFDVKKVTDTMLSVYDSVM